MNAIPLKRVRLADPSDAPGAKSVTNSIDSATHGLWYAPEAGIVRIQHHKTGAVRLLPLDRVRWMEPDEREKPVPEKPASAKVAKQ